MARNARRIILEIGYLADSSFYKIPGMASLRRSAESLGGEATLPVGGIEGSIGAGQSSILRHDVNP
jgi:hypothetical protein